MTEDDEHISEEGSPAAAAAVPTEAAAETAAPSPDQPDDKPAKTSPARKPLVLRILGILCLVVGLLRIPDIIEAIALLAMELRKGFLTSGDAATQVILMVSALCTALTIVGFIVLGIRLLRKRHRGAQHAATAIIVLVGANFLCSLMISGVTLVLVVYFVEVVLLIILSTYIDPALSQERRLHRRLRKLRTHVAVESGTLGRDTTGHGYIKLDFFNLFWVFVIACIIGDVFETVYHMIVIDPGVYQDRAGLLFGPFSPIYGFGAVFMTVALNRFHDKNFVIIFLISAVIGGTFEYLVSWFLQFAFGITAWDYTGTFLSIGGRTNFMFMCIWGCLGIFWIKLMLPIMLRIVNLIPWQWRYTVTTICALLMLADAMMTLIALDCWYSRLAGIDSESAVMDFCAKHFDNSWMTHRFQTMSIDPSSSTRTG